MLDAMCVALVFFAWIYGVVEAEASTPAFALGVMVFAVFILASFGALTVSVDERYVAIKFGYGIFCKKFSVKEVAAVESVKNHWYYGWGIRIWFWPHMWIYNVSGFDAIQITMKSGKIYRIGTNEPAKLEFAIKAEMSKGNQ